MKQRLSDLETCAANLTRRDFVKAAGAVGASLSMTSGRLRASTATKSTSEGHGLRPPTAPNILFILTDQERYFGPSELPEGYVLPGRERLRREGVTFTNHQIGSAVCTSSRSVIYTGQHMQNTGMFDNMGLPWSNTLPKDITTVGHMLQGVGYHAGYLGKWHLSEELEDIEMGNVPEPDIGLLNEVMRGHGFEDYIGVGDIIGMTLGGYRTDEFTTSTAIRWLRAEAARLRMEETPWFLAVNLVNPHDVMFIDTDGPERESAKIDRAAVLDQPTAGTRALPAALERPSAREPQRALGWAGLVRAPITSTGKASTPCSDGSRTRTPGGSA